MQMSRKKWDQISSEFEDLVCDITRTDLKDGLSRYVKSVPTSKHAVLVDLGCGIGSFIKKFGGHFHEIIGVEFAPGIIARAKRSFKNASNITWFTMDINRSARKIGPRADLTVCLNVVTSPSPAKRRSLWSSIARTTKPRGYALIVVPSLESERMVHELSRKRGEDTPFKATADGVVLRDDAMQKHFRRDELEAVLARHGFKSRRIGPVFYPWSEEGLRKPRSAGNRRPWDWVCLAQRVGA